MSGLKSNNLFIPSFNPIVVFGGFFVVLGLDTTRKK